MKMQIISAVIFLGFIRLMTLIIGDLLGDGLVDSRNWAILTSSRNYGKSIEQADIPESDLDGDGIIDSKDEAILLGSANYGRGNIVIP